MTMQNIAGRNMLTAVGSKDDFLAAADGFSGSQATAELQLARMVAFAFVTFHKGGDDKCWAIDHIRATVRVSKDQGRRLSNALGRIPRSVVAEGTSVSKAGVAYGNEFVADFYGIETKARLARKEANKAKSLAKAEEAKKAAAEEVKRIKAEAKKEATDELELAASEIELALVGLDGHIEPLTAAEHMELAMYLSKIRQDVADAEAGKRKAQRVAAKEAA